jgi:hypothetical protein
MENREAIEYLNDVRNGIHIPAPGIELPLLNDKEKEAVDLAIAALEQQGRENQEKPFPFVVGQPAEMFVNGKWEKGKIVAGYRFGDGVVTIETEDGRRLWCGQDRTDIYRPYQGDKA